MAGIPFTGCITMSSIGTYAPQSAVNGYDLWLVQARPSTIPPHARSSTTRLTFLSWRYQTANETCPSCSSEHRAHSNLETHTESWDGFRALSISTGSGDSDVARPPRRMSRRAPESTFGSNVPSLPCDKRVGDFPEISSDAPFAWNSQRHKYGRILLC